MNHIINSAQNKKIALDYEADNANHQSILIHNTSTERIFFQNSDAGFRVNIVNDRNKIISSDIYKIIKNGKLTVKSIIINDKENINHELFFTLKEKKKEKEYYDGLSKELLITRKDLKQVSAYHLINNMTPPKRFNLNNDDNFRGYKYIRNEVVGGYSNNIIIGGDKNDKLAGGAGDDIIIGHKSFDSLLGQDGDDILIGGEGNDGLWGGAGNDILDGGDGRDYLYGDGEHSNPYTIPSDDGRRRGNDIIFGGKGNDKIEGQKNNDYLAGGTGNDRYVFSACDGINMIVEYGGENNTISIDDYFFHQLKFERYGNHLMISSMDPHEDNLAIIIYNQYSEDGYKVKNLNTKSYLNHSGKNERKRHGMVVNNIIDKNPDTALTELSHIKDYGNNYYIDLSVIFPDKMPDTEKRIDKKLIDILVEKNNTLRDMYLADPLYYGDNLPDINYITYALSSFAPKEASQSGIIYLDPQIPINNFVNNFITAKNQ